MGATAPGRGLPQDQRAQSAGAAETRQRAQRAGIIRVTQPGRACTRVLVLLGLDLVETRECHLHHAWRDVHHRAPPRSAAGPESTVSGCGWNAPARPRHHPGDSAGTCLHVRASFAWFGSGRSQRVPPAPRVAWQVRQRAQRAG